MPSEGSQPRDRADRYSVPISLSDLRVRLHLDDGPAHGRVWDLSQQGLCLLMRGRLDLRIRARHTLEVRDAFAEAYEQFDVQIRWIRPDGVASFVGIQFAEGTDLMETLLATYFPVNPWLSPQGRTAPLRSDW